MKHGDFTELARNYRFRPSYDENLIERLFKLFNYRTSKDFAIADIGAGTGKLTRLLLEMGLNVVAVEPNEAMRLEGIEYTKDYSVEWFDGTGENTNLPESSFDWVVMASSFHWTDSSKSLPEFSRILKPNGFFTAMWNPRNLIRGTIFHDVENMIKSKLPKMARVSSGLKKQTNDWSRIIFDSGCFDEVLYIETLFKEQMTKERYMGIWRSVNDIRVQAGEKLFGEILDEIELLISPFDVLNIDYKNTSWTAKVRKD